MDAGRPAGTRIRKDYRMRLAAASATLVALLVLCPAGRCADTKPGFVVVVADDVSWDCFGCTGSKHARTPNIDRLATQGLRLDNMYCAVSQCAPCRAELYTGLYPHHNGVLANAINRKVAGVKSVIDHLTPLGYRVGLTGKSHFNKGTQKFTGISGFPANCNSSIAEHSLDGVKSFITKARGEGAPFCVFICSIHAHHPWDLGTQANFPPGAMRLPDHYIDSPLAREAIARHAAEVELLDRQVGDTMAMLDEMGLARDTVLLFLSEQGTAMPRGKWTIYN
jgi:N-sulfoglucosamine sulfohydrolase